MAKSAKLGATAKRQRLTAAKVGKGQRAHAVLKATSRVTAKVTLDEPAKRRRGMPVRVS
jgi:hypothetical protein